MDAIVGIVICNIRITWIVFNFKGDDIGGKKMKIEKTKLDANEIDMHNFKLFYKGLDISGITSNVELISYNKKTNALIKWIKLDVKK